MPEDKAKVPIGAMLRGPGPAQYSLPSHTGSTNLDVRKRFPPSYTMRPQLTTIGSVRSPGPGKYLVPKAQYRDGTFPGPEYTLRIKPVDLKTAPTPGPGKYGAMDPTVTTEQRAPEYTMRPALVPVGSKLKTPGPNQYKLPNLLGDNVIFSGPKSRFASSESWSMTGRSDVGSFAEVLSKTPGPGRYAPENVFQNVKPMAPHYTMRARTYQPTSSMTTPGPKYNVEGFRAAGRHQITGGTFGTKHSQYEYVVCE